MLTHRLQILVDEERRAALEREARATNRSVGAIVREAIDERLGSHRPPPRGPGRRLLEAPAVEVGEPDELSAELSALSARG